jgi:hypothetical protein
MDAGFQQNSEMDVSYCHCSGWCRKTLCQNRQKEYYNYISEFGEKLIQEDGTIITYELDKYNIDMLNSGNVLLYLYEKEKRKIPESTSNPSTSDRRTAKNERRFFLAQKNLSLSGMAGWFIYGNAFLHALYTRLRERSRCGKSV